VNHTDNIVSLLDEILNEKACNELGIKHQFIRRSSSKLKGHEFIKVMILPTCRGNEDSLNGLCTKIRQFNSEAKMSAQALAQRINSASSPRFMREVFSKILQKSRENIIGKDPALRSLLDKFSDILIEDSSVCKLHESLGSHYEGTNRGGHSGMESQVKIDLIYSIATGTIIDASLHHGKEPDQGLAAKVIQFISPGDLVIRDLGYFVLNVFKKFIEIGAYFLSRLLPNVKIFLSLDDDTPLDLGKHINDNYRGRTIIDICVFLGDSKIPSRLVLYKAPEDIANQRLREAYKRAKDTGRTLSKSKKTLTIYSAFITNVSAKILPAEIVGTLYRLRWDIELIFKQWKSQLQIHILRGLNVNRIECLIWGRLCTVVLLAMLSSYFTHIAQQFQNAELSPVKLINYLLRGDGFFKAVADNRVDIFIENVGKDLPRMLCKDKRRRKTMRGRLKDHESYYGCVA
jgi:hypothetical protein